MSITALPIALPPGADPLQAALTLVTLLTPPGQRRQDWFRPCNDDGAIRRKLLAAGVSAEQIRAIEAKPVDAVLSLVLTPDAWGPSVALYASKPGDSGWILFEAVSADRRMH